MAGAGGDGDARRFANDILAVLIPVLILFSGLFLVVMPWVMRLFASDTISADQQLLDQGIFMARIAFPYLAFMSVATLIAAILNSLSRFAAAAAAPIFLNLCLIAALLTGMVTGDGSMDAKVATGRYLAVAVSVAGLVQLLWLYGFMRRAGFALSLGRPRLTPGVREFGVLILPAIFGAGVYQISRFIDLFFLSALPDKSITYLAMADRLNQLPLGIIGIALGTAILPALSRHIAAADHGAAQRLQGNAVELAMLLTLPAAAALFIAGPALASAFYVGGRFTPADGLATGQIVAALVVGLPAYVLVKVLVPNFFARRDTRTPVITAAISLIANIGLNLVLIPRLGLFGLALAGAIAAWGNALMLYGLLHRRGDYRLSALVAGRLARIVLATALMAGALWWLMPWVIGGVTAGVAARLAAVATIVAVGAAVFFGAAALLGVVSRSTLAALRRR